MKKISISSVISVLIGVAIMFLRTPLGSVLYDNFNDGSIGHRCAAYGYSKHSVNFFGLELYHVESCANLFLVIGIILIAVGVVSQIIRHNRANEAENSREKTL